MLITGCEMKNELLGGETDKTVNGTVQLGVSVKQPLSQSSRADGTGNEASVSTDDFPVVITDANGKVVKDFERVDQIPSSFLLPVGDYTVTSHTKGEVSKNMSSAYYHGSVSMTIEKGITTQTNVICKMKNSRIKINYGDDFLAGFTSWTIVINDGSSQVLTFTHDDKNPAAVYWLFDEGKVTTITVNITAVTSAGNTISDSRTFRKSDAATNYDDVEDYFMGGDALVINMGAVAASSGNITGININTNVTFENHEESVEIPVNVVEPPLAVSEPDGNDYVGNGISITDSSYPTDVTLNFTATKGIKNVYVKLTSDNDDLTSFATTAGMSSDNGLDLVGANSSYFSVPTSGATSYSFIINETFMKVLQQYAGTHKLVVKVFDVNSNSLTRTFNITVTKSATTPTVTDPSITFQKGAAKVTYISDNEISYSKSDVPSEFNAYIRASKGINSIIVKITGGNAAFDALLEEGIIFDDQNAKTGFDIVDNKSFTEDLLGVYKLSGVSKGDTSYDFPIGVFFTLLNTTGVTEDGRAHQFDMVITDLEGNSVSGTLKIHITE